MYRYRTQLNSAELGWTSLGSYISQNGPYTEDIEINYRI